MKYKSIVLALSCTETAQPLVDTACHYSNQYGAPLRVVHVNDPAAGKMSMMMDSVSHKCTKPEIIDILTANNPDINIDSVQIQLLTSKNIAKAISQIINEDDLLIVGHKKMNLIKENLSDSFDEQIVNKVNCHSLVIQI